MRIVRNNMDAVMTAAKKAANVNIEDFCAGMADTSKNEVPVETGNLRDTTTYTMDKNEMIGYVHTETAKGLKKNQGVIGFLRKVIGRSQAGYGFFVHEGTARMSANPFFKRAFESTIRTIAGG